MEKMNRSDLLQGSGCGSERQMAAASSAYDANVMTETVAGRDTLLG